MKAFVNWRYNRFVVSYNPFQKATRLDVITSLGLVIFLGLAIVLAIGPWQVLAKERDVKRTEHVRQIMAALLQLESDDEQTFDTLVARLRAAGDLKVMIGTGDCADSHGPQCADVVTSDACLLLRDFVGDEFLPVIPLDPEWKKFTAELPGYYVALFQGQLEVGSCGATTREVFLRHWVE